MNYLIHKTNIILNIHKRQKHNPKDNRGSLFTYINLCELSYRKLASF